MDEVELEMARMASRIRMDHALSLDLRRGLMQRLEIDHRSHQEWKARYASYFKGEHTPLRFAAEAVPKAPGPAPLQAPVASIRVMPDFGDLAYAVRGLGTDSKEERRVVAAIHAMIPRDLDAQLQDWTEDFNRDAWADCMDGQPGRMQWFAFHLKGVALARRLKQAVGDRARVYYEKPSEDPYRRYDEKREAQPDGSLTSCEEDKTTHKEDL